MRRLQTILLISLLVAFLLCPAWEALAVPHLQLYIPGSTYDTETETWVYPGLEYELWAVGADSSSGTIIEDVYLAVAVKAGQVGTITITPLEGDPLPDPTFFSNSVPVKGDGKALPAHGIYPSDYYRFSLGDFVLNVPGIPDFTQGYDPTNPVPTNNFGKIAKFDVTVTGYDWVHFDLYNHIEGDNHALFAPFSHDADAEDGQPVPEPATMLLLGSGLAGFAALRRKFRKN